MARHPLDLYETPPHYVDALLDVIEILPYHRIYEPCVGKGAIIERLDQRCKFVTNDIDPRRKASTHLDARSRKAWGTLGYNWCITNPPFTYEREILSNALQFCKHVAFLARLSFLEPTIDRAKFWARHASRLTDVVVLPRYSFRRNSKGQRGNDSQTCIWLVFDDKSSQYTRMHFTNQRPSP